MTNWNTLLKSVEIVEAPVRAALVVEAPAPLVAFLAKLRQPGTNQGRQVATLPVGPEGARVLRATLKAATEQLEPAASVTIKSVYADADQFEEIVTDDDGKPVLMEDGTPVVRTVVKDGAEPTHLKFSVGNKRGKRSTSEPASE